MTQELLLPFAVVVLGVMLNNAIRLLKDIRNGINKLNELSVEHNVKIEELERRMDISEKRIRDIEIKHN